jgi:hypothetical protein
MPPRGSRPGKRRGGPWYGEFRERMIFERGARTAFPSMKTNDGRGGGYTVSAFVGVPGYEDRRIQIVFGREHLQTPRVFANGPSESTHRYSDGSLCMWYPPDPEDQRWVRNDGLLELIGHTIRHLFCEAWWRETGHWLGPEAPHGLLAPKPAHARDERDDRDDE